MSEFAPALAFVLAREGGFVDNPADSGGATNFGISLRFLRELPEERRKRYGIFGDAPAFADVKEMQIAQAALIYEGEFWAHAPFGELISQKLCNYVFDMCVHHGQPRAIKILQRASWAVSGMYGYILDDGILGKDTISVINSQCIESAFSRSLFAAICSERAGFCRLLAEVRPKDEEFLHGWLDRCYRF